jgi:hypothetical protein
MNKHQRDDPGGDQGAHSGRRDQGGGVDREPRDGSLEIRVPAPITGDDLAEEHLLEIGRKSTPAPVFVRENSTRSAQQ